MRVWTHESDKNYFSFDKPHGHYNLPKEEIFVCTPDPGLGGVDAGCAGLAGVVLDWSLLKYCNQKSFRHQLATHQSTQSQVDTFVLLDTHAFEGNLITGTKIMV